MGGPRGGCAGLQLSSSFFSGLYVSRLDRLFRLFRLFSRLSVGFCFFLSTDLDCGSRIQKRLVYLRERERREE